MKIENAKYEGYVWYSNAKDPKVINHTFSLEIDEKANPFIIEGQLYDVERKHSISIKFVDGTYIVHEYDIDEPKSDFIEIEHKTFVSNRMGGKRLQFLQYWRNMESTKKIQNLTCEGMVVLSPAELVFVGFEK